MSLKLNLKTQVGTFLVEGVTQLDIFKQVATIQEVFSEQSCGLCNDEDIMYVVRAVGKNIFPELHCKNPECGARLAFGMNQEPKLGSMYPKRKLLKDGKPSDKGLAGEHRGWSKFKGNPDKEGD